MLTPSLHPDTYKRRIINCLRELQPKDAGTDNRKVVHVRVVVTQIAPEGVVALGTASGQHQCKHEQRQFHGDDIWVGNFD